MAEKAKDNGLQVRLEKTLLRRAEPHESAAGGGVAGGGATPTPAAANNASKAGTEIVCNFDEDLLALFNEVIYWEKFHGEFSIPYVAHDLSNKKEVRRLAPTRPTQPPTHPLTDPLIFLSHFPPSILLHTPITLHPLKPFY